MRFVSEELAGLDDLAALPGYEDVTTDLVEAVLQEAAKLASELLAPLNKPGDEQEPRLKQDDVIAGGRLRRRLSAVCRGRLERHQRRPGLWRPGSTAGGAGSDHGNVELGVEIASLGVQVHGGTGYIEETGACQYLRDARIAPIYEGTTGIQAADLVDIKLAMD